MLNHRSEPFTGRTWVIPVRAGEASKNEVTMVQLVVKIPRYNVKQSEQPSVRRTGRPGQDAGRTVRLFERTAQPIGHASRSTRPADRLAYGPTLNNFMKSSIERSAVRSNYGLGWITLRIMRYYASTLNRFLDRSMYWNATRSSMLFDRVCCSIEWHPAEDYYWSS